ncbi:MAG: iron ABC transporter permease [Gammaproteobacteria bacterium]|nr:iron ABC transporter permease [Gammaproteobacteria bacterium]
MYKENKFASLNTLSGAVVAFSVIPLIFVMYNSLLLSSDKWLAFWHSRIPELLWNTLSLATVVAIGSLILAIPAAWFIARRDFPGRRIATWLMVLPLAVPTYVFAHIYTELLEDEGWLGRFWLTLFGENATIPEPYGFIGAACVLSMASFSYVFLLVRSSLSRSSQTLEEAARIQGAAPLEVFRRITLPLLRPAIAAGLAVVVLHVLSDFGAVSMLRFQTFTLSIYLQMNGRFDYQGAAGLSFILVILSLTFLVLERFFRKRQRYYASSQSRVIRIKPATFKEILIIWSWIGTIAIFTFLLPLAWMLAWSWEAWIDNLIGSEFLGYTSNSITVAFIAGSVAVIVALPVALFHTRMRSTLSNVYIQLSSVGFVLPGPVVALGILTFVLAFVPDLFATGGIIILVMALVIRFLPLSVQSQEASLQQLTPSIEQAGRVFGAGPLENFWRVTLPMIRTGVTTAFVLVFIDALKELPATLILRPTGFDTLPVRIWIEASEEMLELAAPAALMLVVGTLPALWIMMHNERQN